MKFSKSEIRTIFFVLVGLLAIFYLYRKNEFRYRLIYRFDDYVIYFLNKNTRYDNLKNSKKLEDLVEQIILDERYDPASATLKPTNLRIDFYKEENRTTGELLGNDYIKPYLTIVNKISNNNEVISNTYWYDKKKHIDTFLFSRNYSLANKLPPQKFDFKDGSSYSINDNVVSLTIQTNRQHSCMSISKRVKFYFLKGRKTFEKYDKIKIELEGGLENQSFILEKIDSRSYVVSSVDWSIACHDTFRIESPANGYR